MIHARCRSQVAAAETVFQLPSLPRRPSWRLYLEEPLAAVAGAQKLNSQPIRASRNSNANTIPKQTVYWYKVWQQHSGVGYIYMYQSGGVSKGPGRRGIGCPETHGLAARILLTDPGDGPRNRTLNWDRRAGIVSCPVRMCPLSAPERGREQAGGRTGPVWEWGLVGDPRREPALFFLFCICGVFSIRVAKVPIRNRAAMPKQESGHVWAAGPNKTCFWDGL